MASISTEIGYKEYNAHSRTISQRVDALNREGA